MPRYRAKYTAQEKKAFANLLRRLMTDIGMSSGAELARKMSAQLPPGSSIDRSTVSWYLTGRSVPNPVYLRALARALNVDQELLLPRGLTQRPGEAPDPSADINKDIRMSMLPDGRMHLMLNVHLPQKVGWDVLQTVQAAVNQTPSAPKK